MALNDYDVGLAFARIEDELIASMMRNLKRHLKEEAEEGFDWSQWQVEQLKYLNEYRRRNKKKYGPQFRDINRKMVEAIREAEEQGQKAEELRILQSISENKKIQRRYANRKPSIEAQGDAFFRVNDKKIEALVDATQNDMQKAEQAVLRRANDQYRKIIFDAQMYANTGAATIEKAVDMATKDFLSRGIDSIVYKNGSRHTIKDYADMYIRTAERRATLMGEGRKRQEWGESLVIINKRGDHPCPKCLEWVGKILIDDVYSGGKPDGKHKLLSKAMAEGLYHPRCKDGHTTYIPGVTSIPDPVTQKEEKEAAKAEVQEQREQLAERQEEKFTRLAENSLDPENKRIYEARAEKWHEQSTGMSVKTEKERIQELNRKTSETVMDNYETRRLQQGLNLVPADDLREQYAVHGNPGSAGYVEFSGLSVQTAETVSGTIEKLSQDYVSGLTHIRTGTAEEFFGAPDAFAYVQHNDRIGDHELLLNPRKMKNYDRMCERIRKASDEGKIAYIPEGLEGEYIATHEFAHGFLQVQRDVRKDWIGQDLKHINHTRKEIRDLYEDYMNEVKLLEEEVAKLEADPDLRSSDIERQMAALERYGEAVDRLNAVKISEYSMENADEFMAEAFTQNRIGVSRSKYSDRVMEVLDREYRLNPENKRKYIAGASEWDARLSYMSHSFRPIYDKNEKGCELRTNNGGSIRISVKRVLNSKFNMFAGMREDRRSQSVRLAEAMLSELTGTLPKEFELPSVAVLDFESNRLNPNAIGGFDQNTGFLFINSLYSSREAILSFVNKTPGYFSNTTEYAPILHELGHKYYYDTIRELAHIRDIHYNEAKRIIDRRLMEYIDIDPEVFRSISTHCRINISRGDYSEVIAECFGANNDNAKFLLDVLREGLR